MKTQESENVVYSIKNIAPILVLLVKILVQLVQKCVGYWAYGWPRHFKLTLFK